MVIEECRMKSIDPGPLVISNETPQLIAASTGNGPGNGQPMYGPIKDPTKTFEGYTIMTPFLPRIITIIPIYSNG